MMMIAPASAGEPVLVKTTSWTHSYPEANRGLAYDGTYYYLAHITYDVPRIDVYDDDGLVKSIPKPAGAGHFWPHGVAVDGQQKKIWTADYFGNTIYEMD
ncbi:MAG: hypothetical protein FJ189_14505, partial [Gammaproteobacteria bacterium]|nr:hypothetical protein [Gammaproteobacteria bacterium]